MRIAGVTQRTYGQYCGIARALELVGERWAMLIVRELLGGPKRYTDLRNRLDGIPTNVLASRLKEMELNGIIYRRILPRPASATVYDLTPYGQELEDILLRLGRWGSRSLEEPVDGHGYIDPAIRALRASFNPDDSTVERAQFEIWFGEFVIHAVVEDDRAIVGEGPAGDADLVIDARGSIIPLLSGAVGPEDAVASGRIRVEGDSELLQAFVDTFRMKRQGPV
jgi:DNA-binding HxlR family transcriptional regulator/putative sterol carrier protein